MSRTDSGPPALRTFTEADQRRFGMLSGDVNPVHLDAVAARRTIAGAPVVHGVHTLLWALEELARRDLLTGDVQDLEMQFGRPVYVGETVTLDVHVRDEREVVVTVRLAGAAAAKLRLTTGRHGGGEDLDGVFEGALRPGGEPIELRLSEVEGRAGRVGFAAEPGAFKAAFPHAAALIGAQRVRGLAAVSRLVGMECPGLHSILAGVSVELTAGGDGELEYRVRSVERRFRMIEMDVAGSGLAGRVRAVMRPEPVRQLSAAQASELVRRGAYAGHHALVVGGSRGLGELTAKLLAAGGAEVTITYALGEGDAAAVAADIAQAGGSAATLRYDAAVPAAPQLVDLSEVTHVYYFATPRIVARRGGSFQPEVFEAYTRIYVLGFQDLVMALVHRAKGELRVLYPSTVFLDERPNGFAEYIAAKAAGEALCALLTRHVPAVTVLAPRLPRLLTDQTATVLPAGGTPATDVIRPLVDEVQRGPSAGLEGP